MKERHFYVLVDDLPRFIQRWVFGIKPPPFRILHGPCIYRVNEFLAAFINSAETTIEFSANDLAAVAAANPLLTSLQGLDYDTIRRRLRVISSLDPVVNRETDNGIIECTIGISETPHCARLRSTFSPKGASIHLEKLEIIPRHLRELRDLRAK